MASKDSSRLGLCFCKQRVALADHVILGLLLTRVPGAANGIGAGASSGAVEPEGSRDAWFGPDLGWAESPVVGRGAVPSAGRAGPLLIEEYDSVIVWCRRGARRVAIPRAAS